MGFFCQYCRQLKKKVELKSLKVFLFNGSMAEVETNQRRLKLKPHPLICWGVWPVKQQPQKTFVLSQVCNMRVILQLQYVGPVTSVSTAVHSVVLLGVLRYSVALLSVFWFSSSTFTHVACWCFCQYSAWSPGDAATVCMREASRWKVCLQLWRGTPVCRKLLAC